MKKEFDDENVYHTYTNCLSPKDDFLKVNPRLLNRQTEQTSTYYVDDPGTTNTYLDQDSSQISNSYYPESNQLHSCNSIQALEVNELLTESNVQLSHLLDVTNNTNNTMILDKNSNIQSKQLLSRNGSVQFKQNTVSPVLLRDIKPKDKFAHYQRFSEQRASQMRNQPSTTSLGSRSSTTLQPSNLFKRNADNITIDDGSLNSTLGNDISRGCSFPKGIRGLLIDDQAEQTEMKDKKKKFKKQKMKMKKRNESIQEKTKLKSKSSKKNKKNNLLIQFKIPQPEKTQTDVINTVQMSPDNMKIKPEQIESACLRASRYQTRPISVDMPSSVYIDTGTKLKQAMPTPPMMHQTVQYDESILPLPAAVVPVRLSKAQCDRLIKAQERIQIQEMKLMQQENQIKQQQQQFDQMQQFSCNNQETQNSVLTSNSISTKHKESIGGASNPAQVSYPTMVPPSIQRDHIKQVSSLTAQFQNTFHQDQLNDQIISFGKNPMIIQIESQSGLNNTFGKQSNKNKRKSMSSTKSGERTNKHSRSGSGISHWENKDLQTIFKSASQQRANKRLNLTKKSTTIALKGMKKSKSVIAAGIKKKAPKVIVKDASQVAILTQEDSTDCLERGDTIETLHGAKEHQNIMLHESPGNYKFQEMNEMDFQKEYQEYELHEINQDLMKGIQLADISSPDAEFKQPQFIDQSCSIDRQHYNHPHQSGNQRLRPKSATHLYAKTINFGGNHDRMRSTSNMSNKVRKFESTEGSRIDIIASHMNHKQKVEGLKSKFYVQKQQEKIILTKQIQLQKFAIMKAKREQKQIQMQTRKQQEMLKEARKVQGLREGKRVIIGRQINAICQTINEFDQENDELNGFKNAIKLEINSELNLIEDIQRINLKYKKLIQEQKREKEKLVATVNGQRKVSLNLQKRKQMFIEDSAKLYDCFKKTLKKDHNNSLRLQKKNQGKSREDLMIFD